MSQKHVFIERGHPNFVNYPNNMDVTASQMPTGRHTVYNGIETCSFSIILLHLWGNEGNYSQLTMSLNTDDKSSS